MVMIRKGNPISLAPINSLPSERDVLKKEVEDLRKTLGAERLDRSRVFQKLNAEMAEQKKRIKELEASSDWRSELVTAIIMGWGASFSTQEMAKKTGLSEAIVYRILSEWREEVRKKAGK